MDELIRTMQEFLDTSKTIYSLVQMLEKQVDEQRESIVEHYVRVNKLEEEIIIKAVDVVTESKKNMKNR